MYAIIVYDTESKNCSKLHKTLKRFLNWNQNSVFEGELTEAQLFDIKKLLQEKEPAALRSFSMNLRTEKTLRKPSMESKRVILLTYSSKNAPSAVDGIFNVLNELFR
jgi:CRISPR-associated protein Cas2